ncbi:MAG: flavodoxin family protein [Bacillota bacterium]|nr:flavodoxin family protein [Bacillota bacterium]
MSKKVLILSSSPRKNGNSDILCDQFAKGAAEAGNDVEKIFLADRKINYCIGCGACVSNKGVCSQDKKDDAAEILDKMVKADVIVMATPVYFYTMAGQMKTLIDRCCSRYTMMNDKELYFIATAAVNSKPALERTFEEFRGFTSCLENPVEKGLVYGIGTWNKGEIRDTEAMKEAYEMGKSC